MLREIQEWDLYRECLITKDKALLRSEFEKSNPRVLRAIVMNENAPLEILKLLRDVKGIKHAREIRENARKTLDKLKSPSS